MKKTKVGSDSVKRPNRPKTLYLFRQFSDRNCVLQFKLKVTKNNFTCIQFADEERFKTLPDDTQCNCYSLYNYSIKVWYAQFIQHSSNAVVFAVN